MWLKYPIIIFIFFIASLFQVSFLPHFGIMGGIPDFIFILFFILIFFNPPSHETSARQRKPNEYYYAFFLVIVAGFFSDVFLPSYFGISMISFLVVYYFKKLIVYFMKEVKDKYFIFYFIPIFSLCFILNAVILYLFSIFLLFLPRSGIPFVGQFDLGPIILIRLVYSLVFACIGFYIYEKISNFLNKDRQLKLL